MRTFFFRIMLLMIAFCGGFSSCMKKELPVPLKPKGQETIASVEMAEDYRWQIYYSLKKNTIVGSNKYTTWDLGFETSLEGWHVILNGAKFRMAAYRTAKIDFSTVNISDTIGVPSFVDAASGNLDSTALGDWRTGNVYILHRGTDETGSFLGMQKIQILSVDAVKYVVRFAALDGTNERTMEVLKDESYNYTFLSFDDAGRTLLIEPPKTEWDIVFTKYTHFYDDLDLRYSVVGCLLNRYQTSAGEDAMTKSFSEIDLKSAALVQLKKSLDAIGFEWKKYDLNSGKFSVDANKYYIISCGEEGVYYKLRFTDFYKNGIKGAPKFEYQRL